VRALARREAQAETERLEGQQDVGGAKTIAGIDAQAVDSTGCSVTAAASSDHDRDRGSMALAELAVLRMYAARPADEPDGMTSVRSRRHALRNRQA